MSISLRIIIYYTTKYGVKLMNNLLFSTNAVVPIFIMVLFGYLLKRKRIINDSFVAESQKLVFTLALPALIFKDISKTDIRSLFNPQLIIFAVIEIGRASCRERV